MKHILLVEDNDNIRENLAEIMELAGYTVQTAANGRLGLAMAMQYVPDLVVCDIMMPELDGFGVLEGMKKEPALQHVPLIFLTAMSEPKEKSLGLEMGAHDYIIKPVGGDELIASIKNHFSKAEHNKA